MIAPYNLLPAHMVSFSPNTATVYWLEIELPAHTGAMAYRQTNRLGNVLEWMERSDGGHIRQKHLIVQLLQLSLWWRRWASIYTQALRGHEKEVVNWIGLGAPNTDTGWHVVRWSGARTPTPHSQIGVRTGRIGSMYTNCRFQIVGWQLRLMNTPLYLKQHIDRHHRMGLLHNHNPRTIPI